MRGEDLIVGSIAFSQARDEETGVFKHALVIEGYGETTYSLEGIE